MPQFSDSIRIRCIFAPAAMRGLIQHQITQIRSDIHRVIIHFNRASHRGLQKPAITVEILHNTDSKYQHPHYIQLLVISLLYVL